MCAACRSRGRCFVMAGERRLGMSGRGGERARGRTATRRFAAVVSFASLSTAGLAAQSKLTMFPPVRGLHEMVGSCNNFEVDAGMRILAAGGNAVDAGVATTLAAGVTELDHFGLGGEIPILIKLAGKPAVVISGIGTAPKRATVAFYEARPRELWEQPGHMPPMPAQGILASPVPGVMDGLLVALEKYGTMSFAQVSAPAIEYADGFPLTEVMADWIRGSQPLLQLWPTSREFFLPNSAVPRRGDVFREPALAKTLRALASAETKAQGGREERLRAVHDYFYKGPIAHEYDEFCARNGGLISYDDMAGFHAETDTPRTGTYRGYEIFKPGFWSQGPVMIELLNLLEGYDLRAMGHNSPEYLHTLVEAIKLAFADRDRYYGDPKFSKIPEQTLLSKDYAAERRKLIDASHASLEHRPGAFGGPSADAGNEGIDHCGEGYDVRKRGGPGAQHVLGDAQRRLAAVGDCGQYGPRDERAHADVRADAGPSERVGAGQAAESDAEPDDRAEGWQAVPGDVDAGRGFAGPDAAAGISEYRGVQYVAAGGD